MTRPLALFKALSDTVRLRIVRAISIAELSVAELVGVLGLPQSTVSRHLKPLRDADLVETRRDGTSIFYRRGSALSDPALSSLVDAQVQQLARSAEDRASVRRVLDHRKRKSRDFFDRIAGRYGTLTEPGGGWSALAAAMAAGFTGKEAADLGAGEGALTLLLARYAARVTAVDASPQMLHWVEEQAKERGLSKRVRVTEGDLEALPLPDGCVDAAFLSQALHHAACPETAVREAARILKPNGVLVILDLIHHEQEWVREQWADLWLGFRPEEIHAWMTAAGLEVQQPVESLTGSAPDLAVLLAVGHKKDEEKNLNRKATSTKKRKER